MSWDIASDFWHTGAFLRRPDGSVQVWTGPWLEVAKDSKVGPYAIGFQDFFAPEMQFLTTSSTATLWTLQETLAALPEIENQWSTRDFVGPSEQKFAANFTEIMARIQRGEIDKAVPMASQFSERRVQPADKVTWMRRFLQAPAPLIPFGYWQGDRGVMGASPEVLFHRRGRQVDTMALAGTLVKTPGLHLPDAIADFLRDPKERHEHALVVADISKQLSRWGRVQQQDLHPMELPTLVNLCTPVQVHIQREDLPVDEWDAQLVRSLHPTPALGVSPRSYGHQWLEGLPGQKERGAFGAPLLFHLQGQGMNSESLCLVLIRSLFWNAQGVQLSAGCGQVAESQQAREWAELLRKLESVHRLLGWL